MKKMSTLFKKDPNDLSKVIDGEYNSENLWVFEDGVKATRKFDGTACAIIDGNLYKRFDAKKGKIVPKGAIECQSADVFSGHHPYWVPCSRDNPSDKYHWEAYDNQIEAVGFIEDGTYELCGVKVQRNAEGIVSGHFLWKHGSIAFDTDQVLENPREFMKDKNIEGIVFHHPDGRMCKIRKKDFGDKR